MEWNSDSVDGDASSDASKWPYANALATLTSDDFLHKQKLPRQVAPPTMTFGDCTFGWPLTKAQAQQLETLHGANAIIPASELHVPDFDAWWTTINAAVLAPARLLLGIPTAAAVGVTLSHLVIDAVGSGDVLKADATTPNTFGSVIIVLPSARKGGAITFAHGDAAERFDAPPSTTLMHVAVTYLQTTITSARLTSGCRYALVLNLVDLEGPRSPKPPAMIRAIEAFKTLAARPTHKHRRIACDIKPINHKLLWEKLGRKDKYLVDVLLATGAYDVVLVSFKKERDYDAQPTLDGSGNETIWDYDKVRYKNINTIARFNEHPACPLPAAMRLMLATRGAHAFPETTGPLERISIPATSVLFWPKKYRAEINGVHSALKMLQDAIKDPAADLLGYASVRDLAQSTVAVFGCGDLRHPIPTIEPILEFLVLDTEPITTTYVTTMGTLLVTLNDVDLVISFLRDAVTITPNTPLDVVAPVVHSLLSTFGWMPLADAMMGLIQRWISSVTGPLLQLLSSLAGVSTQPVCAAVRQPCFGEFLKAAWSTLVHHRRLKLRCTGASACTALLCDLLLLGAHVERSIPEDPSDNWLGAHLPPTLLSVVDDYIRPRRSALVAVQRMYGDDTMALLAHLSQALPNVAASRPEMQLAPFADALLATFDALPAPSRPTAHSIRYMTDTTSLRRVMSPQSFASLLVVLDTTCRCTAEFLSLLWRRWGLSTGFVYAFVKMPVSSSLQALVTAHFVDLAPSLARFQDQFCDLAQGQSAEKRIVVLSRIEPTKNALVLLATLAPDAIPAFTTAWLAALPTTVDATLYRLYPVATWMIDQLGRRHGSAHLTSECLARLRAARAPIAAGPAHEMTDMAIDPEHCVECCDVAAFLQDGARSYLPLRTDAWDLCKAVRKCLAAHSDVLLEAKCSNRDLDGVLKLPPPAGISVAEYTRTQNDQAHLARCIARLGVIPVDVTSPAAKRPRHA